MKQGSGRLIFAASKENENSYERDDLKHGIFTYSMVEALTAHPERPLVRLFAEVRKEVREQATLLKLEECPESGCQQTPVLSRSSQLTDFALSDEAAGHGAF